MILPCFQMFEIMESGPVAGEFLILLMVCLVFGGENSVIFWAIG